MTDQPNGSPRAPDERKATKRREFRLPKRASQAAFTTVVVMAMCTFLLLVQGFFSWTWIFPWGATAVSVSAYFRARATTVPWQALTWVLTQTAFGIGAFCLLVFPARS